MVSSKKSDIKVLYYSSLYKNKNVLHVHIEYYLNLFLEPLRYNRNQFIGFPVIKIHYYSYLNYFILELFNTYCLYKLQKLYN